MSTIGYELMLVAPPDKEEEKAKFVDKIEKYIGKIGKLLRTDNWGVKRLAYSIDDYDRGHYYLFTFEYDRSKGIDSIRELDRMCRIDDTCLRHMIIRKGE